MRSSIKDSLKGSSLDNEAVRYARNIVSDAEAEIPASEATVVKEDFETIYRRRAEHLLDLGASPVGFSELLDAVAQVNMKAVQVALVSTSEKRIIVVRKADGTLIGCAMSQP